MPFGKSKKRESWSSRSLSMIIPENVKLFQRKGKSVMEKAIQDQSRKSIAPNGSYSDILQAQPTQYMETDESSRRYSRMPLKHQQQMFSNPIQEESFTSSSEDVQHSSDFANKAATEAPVEEVKAAPFLTLNLGDTPTSLLDISDQYSSASKHATDESSEIDFSVEESADSSREMPESKDTHELQGLDIGQPVRPESLALNPDQGLIIEETHDLDVSQMPWVLPARDAPLIGNMADLRIKDSSSANEDEPPLMGEHSEAEVPSLGSSNNNNNNNRQDSSISEVSSSELSSPTEFLVDPHRKIMLNRGVYIFDPADTQDVVNLQLSADESFNPFDFE